MKLDLKNEGLKEVYDVLILNFESIAKRVRNTNGRKTSSVVQMIDVSLIYAEFSFIISKARSFILHASKIKTKQIGMNHIQGQVSKRKI